MISINPVDLYRVFSERFGNKFERVADYVDDISNDMENLAAIWQEMVPSIINGNSIDEEKLVSLGIHKYLPSNAAPYYRLRSFYENISTVLSSNHCSERIESVVHRLSHFIMARDSANDALLKLLHQEIGASDSEMVLKELTQTVNQIIMEAAEFRVLAKSIRAIGK